MSGEGVAAFVDDGRLVATDAVTTAIVETIIAERAGMLAFARAQGVVIDQMIVSRRITASEATLLKERLRAFADGIAIGLHRDGVEDPRVRAALRKIAGGTVNAAPFVDRRVDADANGLAGHIAAGNGDD